MADMMTFPDTVEEFMNQYKIVDTDGIYMSKEAEMIPVFRMKQWFEHLPSAQQELVDQIRWERDVAIEQLADLGYSLGEKPRVNGDLISRKDAIRIASGHCHPSNIAKELAKLPSAQPEIIRCKDCKNWDTTWQNDYAPNYHYCPIIDGTHNGDWYCADAERRTDG